MPCISSKGLRNIVLGEDVRPIVVTNTSRVGTQSVGTSIGDARFVEDVAGSTSIAASERAPQPTVEQLC